MPGFYIFSRQMYTPLHASSSSGQINVVKLLLEMAVELDVVNSYGNTSLHIACLNGQDVVVSELVAYGAGLNTSNCKGQVGDMIIINMFLSVNSHKYYTNRNDPET